MGSQKQILYKKRAFLNPEGAGGIAAIDAEVELSETENSIHTDACLHITDCSNQISLDFDLWSSNLTRKFLRDRRKKIDHLRSIVNDFLDACEEAYDEIEDKYQAKAEAARKTK